MLKRRFGCSHREHMFRSELRGRVRGPSEALPKLADEIERLVFLAYPSAPADYRAMMTCDHFIDALADTELHIAVRQSRPSSLSDALTSALEIESIRRSNDPPGRVPSSGTGFKLCQARTPEVVSGNQNPHGISEQLLRDILRCIEQLEAATSSSRRELTAGRGRGTLSKSGRSDGCWRCGQTGHFRRDCRADVPARGTTQRQSEN